MTDCGKNLRFVLQQQARQYQEQREGEEPPAVANRNQPEQDKQRRHGAAGGVSGIPDVVTANQRIEQDEEDSGNFDETFPPFRNQPKPAGKRQPDAGERNIFRVVRGAQPERGGGTGIARQSSCDELR